MGSDNPPPPAGRLKARNKAQLVRAFVVTCAVVLLLYLTSDIAELDDGIASATGPEPGPAFPPPAILKAKPAKGAAIDSGEKLPKRKHARQDSMPRRENREVVAGSHPVKRDSVGEGRQHREVIEKPLPVTPKPPVYHGLYDLSAVDIKGVPQLLQQYGGRVVLVVNVASACGYTASNYDGLRELYNKYHSRGFTVLAFPCNQFGEQEPGTNEEVEVFAQKKGAQFPLFSKIEVNGENTHEVYRYLKRSLPGEISWNFNKFLVDRDGTPVKRYGPQFDKEELERDIEKYLAAKEHAA